MKMMFLKPCIFRLCATSVSTARKVSSRMLIVPGLRHVAALRLDVAFGHVLDDRRAQRVAQLARDRVAVGVQHVVVLAGHEPRTVRLDAAGRDDDRRLARLQARRARPSTSSLRSRPWLPSAAGSARRRSCTDCRAVAAAHGARIGLAPLAAAGRAGCRRRPPAAAAVRTANELDEQQRRCKRTNVFFIGVPLYVSNPYLTVEGHCPITALISPITVTFGLMENDPSSPRSRNSVAAWALLPERRTCVFASFQLPCPAPARSPPRLSARSARTSWRRCLPRAFQNASISANAFARIAVLVLTSSAFEASIAFAQRAVGGADGLHRLVEDRFFRRHRRRNELGEIDEGAD